MSDRDFIQDFLRQPRESLSTELKDWIDPRTIEGCAKIVKTCFALYNSNGGWLFIGFDNKTGESSSRNEIDNVAEVFHPDVISHLISKYASKPFAPDVYFHNVNGRDHPIIKVPSGVRAPVVSRSEISNKDSCFLKASTVYVRSVGSNGTVSSTETPWREWSDVAEVWSRNQQDDILSFLRRLAGNREYFHAFAEIVGQMDQSSHPTICQLAEAWLEEGRSRYVSAIRLHSIAPDQHGAMEFGALVSGILTAARPNLEFRQKVLASNPNLTGWPFWVDSSGFHDAEARPKLVNGAWEALIHSPGTGWGAHHDFWAISPAGKFYHRRPFQDDIGGDKSKREPLTKFEPILATYRVAEGVAVALRFARLLAAEPEKSTLAFATRWTGLGNRELAVWGDLRRHLSAGRRSYTDVASSCVEVPLTASDEMLPEYVQKLMEPVLEVFDGFQMSTDTTASLTREILQRRL